MDGDRGPVEKKQQKDHQDKEEMNHQGGEDFHQRENTDAEGHLLDQEAVLDDRPGGARHGIGKEEPGDDAGGQPEDIGDILDRFALEGEAEDEPEDGDVDSGVDKGPEHTEVGAEVLGLKVAPGHLQDQLAAGKELGDKGGKKCEIMHNSARKNFIVSGNNDTQVDRLCQSRTKPS